VRGFNRLFLASRQRPSQKNIRIVELEMLPERGERQGAKRQTIPEMLERLSLCCLLAKARAGG